MIHRKFDPRHMPSIKRRLSKLALELTRLALLVPDPRRALSKCQSAKAWDWPNLGRSIASRKPIGWHIKPARHYYGELTSLKPSSTQWPQIYLCVALTTMATLVVELSLTRIFSVVFYYHMAFLAISIAMFGLGAGGVFSYVVAGWKGPLYTRLGRLSMVNSLLVLLALAVILAQRDVLTNWNLALVYFTTALPFFVSGTIVSLAISETMERVDRVYFWDLLGAAGGCMLLIPLLNQFGGPSTVVAAAVLFAVAAAVWHSMAGSKTGRAGSVALAIPPCCA